MQLHSPRTFQPRPSAKESIPYSSEALRQDLQRVRDAWADCQATRDRNAIYAYLTAVYGLVACGRRKAGKSTELAGLCVYSGWKSLIEKTPSPRSSGAPPTRPRPTNGPGASGRG